MIRKLIVISTFCFIITGVFSQSKTTTQKLELSGSFKKTPQFNTENIKLQIGALEQSSQVKISFEIIGNNNYTFYLFDDIALEGSSDSDWKDLFSIYKWAKNKSFFPGIGISSGKYKFAFDGTFIKYDRQFLNRSLWQEEEGFKQIMGKMDEADIFSVINTIELPSTTLEYVFLVTEQGKASEESILGITKAVKIKIGKSADQPPVVQQVKEEPVVNNEPEKKKVSQKKSLKEKKQPEIKTPVIEKPKTETVLPQKPIAQKVAVEIPKEDEVVQKWDNYVKNVLLKPFLDKEIYSYDEIAEDKFLNLDYEQKGYAEKIDRALLHIDMELADAKYNTKRTELWGILNSFRKKEIELPVVEETLAQENKVTEPKQVETGTVTTNQEAAEQASAPVLAKTPQRPSPRTIGRATTSGGSIDSVVFYYRKVLKMSTRISMNTNLSENDVLSYRQKFSNDSLSFVAHSSASSHPSTERYKQDFNRIANQVNGRLYNNTPAQTSARARTSAIEYPDEQSSVNNGEPNIQGNKAMRYVLIILIAAIFIGMFVFVFKRKK